MGKIDEEWETGNTLDGEFWDDASGGELDPELIRKAQREEMEGVRKHQV